MFNLFHSACVFYRQIRINHILIFRKFSLGSVVQTIEAFKILRPETAQLVCRVLFFLSYDFIAVSFMHTLYSVKFGSIDVTCFMPSNRVWNRSRVSVISQGFYVTHIDIHYWDCSWQVAVINNNTIKYTLLERVKTIAGECRFFSIEARSFIRNFMVCVF